MQWIPCSVVQWILIERSGFHASWCNGSQLNAVNSMQRDWMQYIPCSKVKCIPIKCRDSIQLDRMQLIPWSVAHCIPIKCSGFYTAWPKASWLNAVESMGHHWMQSIPCIVAQWIPIVCSGVHAVWWMHGMYCIQSRCMEFTAFNQNPLHHTAWNPLHSIEIHWATLHGIHCIQSGSI